MNSQPSSSTRQNKGVLFLCPSCQFRVSIINNYSSSNSYHTSLISFNSDCANSEHKKYSSNYINNFQNTMKFCTKHNETIGEYSCIKCKLFFCEQCALEHTSKMTRHDTVLHEIRTNTENSENNCNYNKEKFLEVKKQQAKLIEELVKQMVFAKEAVENEIHQIDKYSNK